MELIRVHKSWGIRVVCAILLAAIFYGYLCPCHEYSAYGAVILGCDTCDDSPCLPVGAEDASSVPAGFFNMPKTKGVIPRTFVFSIFHPPHA
jgi:hypothetical protein